MRIVPNRDRGLRILGTKFSYLDEGEYGLVFVDREQNRVRKIYRGSQGRSLEDAKAAFEREVAAYQIAMNHSEIRRIVPAFHGVQMDQRIVDKFDNSFESIFPNFAFEANYINAPFQKLIQCDLIIQRDLNELFRDRGINYLTDSSVNLESSKVRWLIDFATEAPPEQIHSHIW